MQFHIDTDTGAVISGWLIPDNPSDDAEFLVRIPDRPDIRFGANVLRSDIFHLGMHPTGLVGFQLDSQMVPDIETVQDVSIHDANLGLCIYRRVQENLHLRSKLLFLDYGGMPQFRILRSLIRHFALSYPVIETWPLETATAIIGNGMAKSIAIFGQLNWSRQGGLLREKGYTVASLLHNPFEELAERLLFLSLIQRKAPPNTTNTFLARFRALLPLAETVRSGTDKTLLAAFRGLTSEQRRLIRSPMTTTLACAPDEEPHRKSVSTALDNLSQFDIVGVRSRFPDFGRLVEAIIGTPGIQDVELESIPETRELADRLSNIGIVGDLLDEDIALYSFVSSSLDAAYGAELEDSRPS